MSSGEEFGKILLVDANVFFAKRLSEALQQKGFEVIHCTQTAYALTMVEWDMPVAILCATSFSDAGEFEIPRILQADAKTSHIPVIAVGDSRERTLFQAFRAGFNDYVDRRLGPENIASQVLAYLSSRHSGFQPTQMLGQSETALDGRLSLLDLPSVIQMISQSRQSGALHINAGQTDGIIFFDAGEILHAESGLLAGEDAVTHMVKECNGASSGVYKFVPGSASTIRTVQRSVAGLILDALREVDEQERDLAVERGHS
jgi:CheY-like chemotaxis protein